MKNSHIIELLQNLDPDAPCRILLQNGTTVSTDHVYASRDGYIILAPGETECYENHSRPVDAPSVDDDCNWKTAESLNSTIFHRVPKDELIEVLNTMSVDDLCEMSVEIVQYTTVELINVVTRINVSKEKLIDDIVACIQTDCFRNDGALPKSFLENPVIKPYVDSWMRLSKTGRCLRYKNQ